MGNAASCTPSLTMNNNCGGIKVLSLDGRLESYTTRAVKAAEIMVENPGQFVCDSSFLKVGHRIQGLLADEDLERGKFYFLLPMDLLYSVLTHEEISLMNYRASRAMKKHGGFSKIFPISMFHNSHEEKRLQNHHHHHGVASKYHDEDEENAEKRYLTKQGSWRPALETIDETP